MIRLEMRRKKLRGGRLIVWGDSSQSGTKSQVATALLREIAPQSKIVACGQKRSNDMNWSEKLIDLAGREIAAQVATDVLIIEDERNDGAETPER